MKVIFGKIAVGQGLEMPFPDIFARKAAAIFSGLWTGRIMARGWDRIGVTHPDPIYVNTSCPDPTRPDPTRPDPTLWHFERLLTLACPGSTLDFVTNLLTQPVCRGMTLENPSKYLLFFLFFFGAGLCLKVAFARKDSK